MPDIRCWNCEGAGKFVRVNGVNDAEAACFLCNGTGTIPDRRRPTATDRAVERIKAYCAKVDVCDSDEACVDCARVVRGVIREEAERHE